MAKEIKIEDKQADYFADIQKYKKELDEFIETFGVNIPYPKFSRKNRELGFESKIKYCKSRYKLREHTRTLRDIENRYIEKRNKIASLNEGLARNIAQKCWKNGLDLEDLIQQGKIGLLKAIESYNPHSGNTFSTYAFPSIRNAIYRGISYSSNEAGKSIRIPPNLRKEIINYQKEVENFRKENGREPSKEELLINLKINPDRLDELQSYLHLFTSASLDKPIGDDEDSTLIDFISPENPKKTDLDDHLPAGIETLLNSIDESRTNKAIFRHYYGIGTNYRHTLDEVGKSFGKSRERIRKICQIVSKKIKYIAKNPNKFKLIERVEPRQITSLAKNDMKKYNEIEEIKNEKLRNYYSKQEAAEKLRISCIIFDRLIKEKGIKFERKYHDNQECTVIHEKIIRDLRKSVSKKDLLIGGGKRRYFSEEDIAAGFGIPIEKIKEIIKNKRIKRHQYGLGINRDDIDRIEKMLEHQNE